MPELRLSTINTTDFTPYLKSAVAHYRIEHFSDELMVLIMVSSYAAHEKCFLAYSLPFNLLTRNFDGFSLIAVIAFTQAKGASQTIIPLSATSGNAETALPEEITTAPTARPSISLF